MVAVCGGPQAAANRAVEPVSQGQLGGRCRTCFRAEVDSPRTDDVPQLSRKVADLLALSAESVPASARGSEASQNILRTLVTTVGTLAELRNEFGIDHGKSERSAALARHAKLALNVTVTVAEFILETGQDRLDSGQLNDHAR